MLIYYQIYLKTPLMLIGWLHKVKDVASQCEGRLPRCQNWDIERCAHWHIYICNTYGDTVYDVHNKNNNDTRVIGIAQLSLSAVLKMAATTFGLNTIYSHFSLTIWMAAQNKFYCTEIQNIYTFFGYFTAKKHDS